MGSFAHPDTFGGNAAYYRRRAASIHPPPLRDAYEQLAEAYEAMAHWKHLADEVHRLVHEMEREQDVAGASHRPPAPQDKHGFTLIE